MSDTAKKTVHPRMAEAIANAEKAAVSNRGMYPHTKACNVFQSSGERMEDLASDDVENKEDINPPGNDEEQNKTPTGSNGSELPEE